MTKHIIDFSKNIIYKIVCKDLEIKNTYVGHTTDFTRRKSLHKHCCNNSNSKAYNLKIYKVIRENGGWANWSMVEIEKYPCIDKNEAGARERYWYENLNANMNNNVPGRGGGAFYRDNNRDVINSKFTCECGGKYTRTNKVRHLQTTKHQMFKMFKTKILRIAVINELEEYFNN